MSWEERYARETERRYHLKHADHGRLKQVGYTSHDESGEAFPLRGNGIFRDQSGVSFWLRGSSWSSGGTWGGG